MKVVLVAVNSKYIHSNLAVRYLKAYTKDMKYQCNTMEFSINDREERVVEDILQEKPDIIGFSCYIWNIEFIKKVATLIKLVDSKIEIIYGGPETSFSPIEFLENNIGEYLIEGEGEETYRELIDFKINNKINGNYINCKNIKGLYSKDEGRVYYGGKRPLMNMNNIVFPYGIDDDLKNKIVYYEGSRGCPFNCKYCLSSTTHGVRFLELERVLNELQFFIDKKVKLVKFVDRTFNCNKVFANAIWNYLIENGGETCFHFEVSADLFSNESVDILREAPNGMFQFEVGVQTTNNEILNNINRSIKFSTIKEKVLELNKLNNIKQHLDLIAGLPGEDFNSFRRSFNEVYEISPKELQLGFLKLLKGSQMREESEAWGMIYSPYPPYEILKTKDISYDELIILKKIEHMVDKYLNSGKFYNILKFFSSSKKFEDIFEFYYELSKFFDRKGYFKRNIAAVDYYYFFVEFNKFIKAGNEELLLDIIRYEYFSHNNTKWVPDFLKMDVIKSEERRIKQIVIDNNCIENINKISVFMFNYNIKKFINDALIEKSPNYIAFIGNHSKDKIFIPNNELTMR
ncbi:radical SAM protein [Clostridium sp.]|uniref:B12-binding domain-containing radical SAM protein n=1 Tax=Clostridium sp. TaxID=1506 RepID=UPI0032167E3B